jgi:hypothetical protein
VSTVESNVSGEKKGSATLSGFLTKLENIKFVL